MKKIWLVIIVLIAILTNPDQDRHKEVIKIKLNAFVQKNLITETKNEREQANQVFGLIVGGAVIKLVVDNLVSTDNFVLFSTTKINWKGEVKIIGVGIFGNVFITRKLDEALNDGLLENR